MLAVEGGSNGGLLAAGLQGEILHDCAQRFGIHRWTGKGAEFSLVFNGQPCHVVGLHEV